MNNEPKTLQSAIQYFSDEQTCIDIIASLRWPDGKPTCPACGKQDHYYLATQKRWKCKECWKQFSVKVGTIFEDSPISLDKWLVALWMLVNCRNGISSYEIARAIGITQKSAWFVLHRLRYALKAGSINKIGGGSAPVEVDETYYGPNILKMHKDRRGRAKRGGKAIVMGLLERGGHVRAAIVPAATKEALHGNIKKHVTSGSTVYTDDWLSYYGIRPEYVHEVITHTTKYVNGQIHTNGIENFWSLLKRGLRGTYVNVEPFHLERYVDEQVFRYNNRKIGEHKITDSERFATALRHIGGKRLTFAELTGKVTPTCN